MDIINSPYFNRHKLHNIKAKLCNINNTEWINNLFSSSTEFVLQNIHFRSFNGIFGLVYRPVSTANGKQPLLKFDKIRLCCLFKTFTYELHKFC
jgi:hypothetical protein